MQALRNYAAAGGSLVATFETGLYDETGKPRSEFALGDLFGIRRAGGREKATFEQGQSMIPVFLQSLRDAKHPMNAGFEDTTWFAGPVWRVPLASVAGAAATFIDPYPGYPTEAVFQRKPPTDLPTVVTREDGRFAVCLSCGRRGCFVLQAR